MTAVLLPQGKQQYFTAAGIPLVGGRVFTYDTGTTTPRLTWSDAAQTSQNANPVILDARGEASIFWSGAYRVVVQDSLGNAIWTQDGVSDQNYGDILRAELASSAIGADGSRLIGFRQPGTGSVGMTVFAVLNGFVLPEMFGAVGDGNGNGAGTDDSAAIQLALNWVRDFGGELRFIGTKFYRCNSVLTLLGNTPESNTTNRRYTLTGNGAMLDFSLSGLTSGNLLSVGASIAGNISERGQITISGLVIKGPETGAAHSSPVADTTCAGLRLQWAENVTLINVYVRDCWIGFETEFVFPLDAYGCRARNCYIPVMHKGASNNQEWHNFQCADVRFGPVMQYDGSNKIVGITYFTPRVENARQGFLIDPTSASGTDLIRDIRIFDPWFSDIDHDIVRVGYPFDAANPGTRGTARIGQVWGLRLSGGNWGTAVPWSTTHGALVMGGSSVRGLRAEPFPVEDSLLAVVGTPVSGVIDFDNSPHTTSYQSHRVAYDADQNRHVEKWMRTGETVPTTGTWNDGDRVWLTDAAAGASPGSVCVTPGTYSPATDNTGDTDGSTGVVTGLSDTSDFIVGEFVSVSAGFPTTGPYKILALTASTITVSVNSNSAQNNITVATVDPVWKAMGAVAV